MRIHPGLSESVIRSVSVIYQDLDSRTYLFSAERMPVETRNMPEKING